MGAEETSGILEQILTTVARRRLARIIREYPELKETIEEQIVRLASGGPLSRREA